MQKLISPVLYQPIIIGNRTLMDRQDIQLTQLRTNNTVETKLRACMGPCTSSGSAKYMYIGFTCISSVLIHSEVHRNAI